METLSNGILEIAISPIGAEMQSIRRVVSPYEYLWQGDATYWDRRSPILFPITGKVWNNTAYFSGAEYHLTQHGFLRDMTFTKIVDEDRHMAFVCKANEESLKLYPFNFEVRIDYTLLRNVLTITWSVTNNDMVAMPFQIGAHPGFNYPRYNENDEEHGFLSFDAESPLISTKVPGGYCADDAFEVPIPANGMLPLTNETFECDTILDCTNRVHRITLHDKNGKPYITVLHQMPVTAIWSPCNGKAPFICIEPWWGRCDDTGFVGDFARKPFVESIEPGRTWQDEYQIIIE